LHPAKRRAASKLRSLLLRHDRKCEVFRAVERRHRGRSGGRSSLAGADRLRLGGRSVDYLVIPDQGDTSPALAVVSGIYLLLTALLSFGLGGYVAGRLRERWNPTAPSNVVEFRDGTHGVLAWAVAVVAVRADAPSPIDPIDTSGCVAWLGEHERAKRNHDGEHRCATSTEALCSVFHFGYLLDSTSARNFHRFRTIK
jgi:hypothetical protein